jgi:hypothetical protein
MTVFIQVYPDGIRHIRADKRVNEWKTPGKKSIVKCAVNQRQVVIALTGGELVYFEMDPVSYWHCCNFHPNHIWEESMYYLFLLLMEFILCS